jgi:hypothetical protein
MNRSDLVPEGIYWRNYTDNAGNNYQSYIFAKIIDNDKLLYRIIKKKKKTGDKYWMMKARESTFENFLNQVERRITDLSELDMVWSSIRSSML